MRPANILLDTRWLVSTLQGRHTAWPRCLSHSSWGTAVYLSLVFALIPPFEPPKTWCTGMGLMAVGERFRPSGFYVNACNGRVRWCACACNYRLADYSNPRFTVRESRRTKQRGSHNHEWFYTCTPRHGNLMEVRCHILPLGQLRSLKPVLATQAFEATITGQLFPHLADIIYPTLGTTLLAPRPPDRSYKIPWIT